MNEESTLLPRHPMSAFYTDFIIMTFPLMIMGTYLYGLRVLMLAGIAAITANLCDRLVATLRRQPYDKSERSSIAFALILTLLMPASISIYIVILATCVAVLVGKAAFGGYGHYPFSPLAIGFAVAAVSWPDKMFSYPQPFALSGMMSTKDVLLGESAAHTLAAGGMPNISLFDLALGNYAGAMGVTAVLVIVACAMYLWVRKRITLFAPLGFLLACAAIAYFFPRLGGIGFAAPWHFVRYRLLIVNYELLSGAILYASVFLINDPVCLPKSNLSRLVFGAVLGFATMMFRYFGSYDMGVCFALLAINALSGPIDRGVMLAVKLCKEKGGKANARKQHT